MFVKLKINVERTPNMNVKPPPNTSTRETVIGPINVEIKKNILVIQPKKPFIKRAIRDESSLIPKNILYKLILPKLYLRKANNAKNATKIAIAVHVDIAVVAYDKYVLTPKVHIIKCIQFHPANDNLVKTCLTKN